MSVPSFRAARLQVIGAAVLFSTGGAAIKATGFDGLEVACFRSGVAALALALMLPRARRGWTWRTLLVGCAFAVTLVLFVSANKLTTSANTIFLQSTAPLYLLALGPWLLRERARPRDLVFMAVLGVGLSLFFVDPGPAQATAPHPLEGNLLALLSGVGWALTLLGLRWLGRSRGGSDAAGSATVAGNLIAFVVCLPFSLGASGDAGDWALVVYLGVIQIALAYVLLTLAVRFVPALEVSLLLFVEPALNPIWTWLVHGETPGALALVGGALILGATAAKTWWDLRYASGPRSQTASGRAR